ncbi:YIP1 family protein [Aliikangiella coralliicola]|uniref:YIP1 family protein n=1 Tax=Aliikangiella coralliicola TaxID=2592383 RepID=A0A545UAU9_9GAMM|nr:YIP1 family protein [Aliikangiella coralliicola]TQV86594.1 YIP1 family protein [Aliikangiella coralliicola]
MTKSPYDVSEENLASESPKSLTIFTNIFAAPQKAYEDLKYAYPVAFPLLTIVLLNMALIIALYATIDYEWFVDHMVEMQAGDVTKAEQDQMRQGMEMMSPSMMGGFGAVMAGLGIAAIYCIQALYFVIVSGITNDGFQFKQWLSFVSWSSLPSLLGTLASAVVVFTSTDGQLSPESLNPLSLNELFFGMNAIEGMGNILATTDITMFWSIALLTIGYSKWTGKDTIKSFMIVILPFVLYYGIRLLFI